MRHTREEHVNAQQSEERVTKEIVAQVLKKVVPSVRERQQTLQFAQELTQQLAERLPGAGIPAEVQVQGSIAKDTWLSGDKDIDMFIALPRSLGQKIFPKVLDVAKSLAGENWIEAYAEHPYIKAQIGTYTIDFVPCFSIAKAEDAGSAVDRTPLHTAYIKENLRPQAKNEVRLLKQFMRGIGTYGAEIKVKGFSGYLCELIILNSQSFFRALQEIATWRFGQLVDLENLTSNKPEEARQRFHAPLIVIDPVDAKRNVAAAVSEDRLGELILAAKSFLNKPNRTFFFPPKTRPLREQALKAKLENLGSDLVFICIRSNNMVPDVLWGQLYKTAQAFGRLLSQKDFQVLRNVVWSDEHGMNLLIFEMETRTIPLVKKHMGPPADSDEAKSFIDKYTGKGVEAGLWIEEGRWYARIQRRHTDVGSLLKENLLEKSANLGISGGLLESAKATEIYVNTEILPVYRSTVEFAMFLTDFLRGKPKWIT